MGNAREIRGLGTAKRPASPGLNPPVQHPIRAHVVVPQLGRDADQGAVLPDEDTAVRLDVAGPASNWPTADQTRRGHLQPEVFEQVNADQLPPELSQRFKKSPILREPDPGKVPLQQLAEALPVEGAIEDSVDKAEDGPGLRLGAIEIRQPANDCG